MISSALENWDPRYDERSFAGVPAVGHCIFSDLYQTNFHGEEWFQEEFKLWHDTTERSKEVK